MLTIIGVIYGIDVISYFDIVRVVVDDERAILIVALFDPAVAVIVTVGAGKVVVVATVGTGKVVVVATVGAGKVGVTDDDSFETEDVPSAYFTTTLNVYGVPLVKPDIVVILSDAPIVFVGGLDGGLDVTK